MNEDERAKPSSLGHKSNAGPPDNNSIVERLTHGLLQLRARLKEKFIQ